MASEQGLVFDQEEDHTAYQKALENVDKGLSAE